MGVLMDAIKQDANNYIISGGFESNIKITTPDGLTEFDTTGYSTKHHINFDTDGTAINSKNAHVTLSEKTLTDSSYPVRVNGEIDLEDHTIVVKDSSNVDKTYVIKETLPDETLGLIVCILGDFE